MLRILVTNDDGIDSPGLHVLARALTSLGEVTVFAPSGEYSGAGASIGHLGAGIADVHRVERPELAAVAAAYHFDGPPALAALLAVNGLFGARPDVVVSGINPGWNVGMAIHFSGTVGAAVTAQQLGVPGLAVSQHAGGPQHWEVAAAVAVELVPGLVAEAEPAALTVNVPNVEAADLLGIREGRLSDRLPYRLRNARLAPTGNNRFAVTFDRDAPYDSSPGTDTALVEAGYAAVTRLRPTSH